MSGGNIWCFLFAQAAWGLRTTQTLSVSTDKYSEQGSSLRNFWLLSSAKNSWHVNLAVGLRTAVTAHSGDLEVPWPDLKSAFIHCWQPVIYEVNWVIVYNVYILQQFTITKNFEFYRSCDLEITQLGNYVTFKKHKQESGKHFTRIYFV